MDIAHPVGSRRWVVRAFPESLPFTKQNGQTWRFQSQSIALSPRSVLSCSATRPDTPRPTSKLLEDREKQLSDRVIVRMVKKDRRVTAKEIQANIPDGNYVSLRTIERRVTEAGFKGGWSLKKPWISDVNRKKRLQWAKDHLLWSLDQWKRLWQITATHPPTTH